MAIRDQTGFYDGPVSALGLDADRRDTPAARLAYDTVPTGETKEDVEISGRSSLYELADRVIKGAERFLHAGIDTHPAESLRLLVDAAPGKTTQAQRAAVMEEEFKARQEELKITAAEGEEIRQAGGKILAAMGIGAIAVTPGSMEPQSPFALLPTREESLAMLGLLPPKNPIDANYQPDRGLAIF